MDECLKRQHQLGLVSFELSANNACDDGACSGEKRRNKKAVSISMIIDVSSESIMVCNRVFRVCEKAEEKQLN